MGASALLLVLLLALVHAYLLAALQVTQHPEGPGDDRLPAFQSAQDFDVEIAQQAGLDRHELGLPLVAEEPDALLVSRSARLEDLARLGLDLTGHQGLDG